MEDGRRNMKRIRKQRLLLGKTAGLSLLFCLLGAGWAWAAEGWQEENGQWYYYENEIKKTGQWLYEDADNSWYYLDDSGRMCVGEREILGDTYFFGEDGRMLTGWVSCPNGEVPERFAGSTMEEDVFFCGADGKMSAGWVQALSPEAAALLEDEEIFEGIQNKEYEQGWYCFRDSGQAYYDVKKWIGDKLAVFDETGKAMSGWIYDQGESGSPRYVKVDKDTSESDIALYAQTPENYMYGIGDGTIAVKCWFDTRPQGLEEEESEGSRSYYADSQGFIVTDVVRGSGASIAAQKKAVKIGEIGTYTFEDWSTDVNVVRIDGRYYLIENSGTRIDGMIYLSSGDHTGSFRDGIYCFDDGAAMETGHLLKENTSDDFGSDGYCYYYYFMDRTDGDFSKGQGFTGVDGGRLYYQGLAVAAQMHDWEVVYVPTLADKKEGATGLFLIDTRGMVKKGTRQGSTCRSTDGNKYKVVKESEQDEKYGWHIYIVDEDENEEEILIPVTDDMADYIHWDAVEG